MEYDIRDFFTTESLESIEGIEEFVDVEKAFNRLPERERKITYLHLAGYTMEEIGAETGLTKGRISQILQEIKQSGFQMPQD